MTKTTRRDTLKLISAGAVAGLAPALWTTSAFAEGKRIAMVVKNLGNSYFDACSKLARSLHRAFARDLDLPLDFFVDKLDRPLATLRALHYPASSGEGEIGAGEHTDYGNITLLATDDVGGLEVRTRAGQWIAAPPMKEAYVVNIGDCLMRWTNDVYVSTPHRVVNRSGRERYSIAFFFDPNPEARVEAIPSCVAAGAAALYPPILAADYIKMRLDASKPAM